MSTVASTMAAVHPTAHYDCVANIRQWYIICRIVTEIKSAPMSLHAWDFPFGALQACLNPYAFLCGLVPL